MLSDFVIRQPWLMWFTITQMPPLHITAGCILDPDTPNSLNHELEQMCAPVQHGFQTTGKWYKMNPYCYCYYYCFLSLFQIHFFFYITIFHNTFSLRSHPSGIKTCKILYMVNLEHFYLFENILKDVAWCLSHERTARRLVFNLEFI